METRKYVRAHPSFPICNVEAVYFLVTLCKGLAVSGLDILASVFGMGRYEILANQYYDYGIF